MVKAVKVIYPKMFNEEFSNIVTVLDKISQQYKEGFYTEKEYVYLLPKNLSVKAGDYVLIFSSKPYIVLVTEVLSEKEFNETRIENMVYKYVISKLDFTHYKKEFMNTERIKELEKQIDARIKKVSKLLVLKSMAEKDPETKNLLSEYEKLIK